MSSKRAVRRKSCETKVRHSTQEQAWATAHRLMNGAVPYKCRFGNHWHTGHHPAQVKRSVEARRQ